MFMPYTYFVDEQTETQNANEPTQDFIADKGNGGRGGVGGSSFKTIACKSNSIPLA